jgi:single-strand DNA-binding protein
VNVVTLIGNLCTDVNLKELPGDKRVANFLLAVDRPSKDGGADFVGIAVWDRQAELCARYLAKGRRVAIDGRLRSRSWEEDGKRRSAVEVVANRVQFLSPGDGGATDAEVPFEEAAMAS